MRIKRKVGVGVVVLGSLLLAISGAAPALARSSHAAGPYSLAGLRFARTANMTSPAFAGWEFGAKAAAGKSLTSEFKIPALKCTSTTSGIAPANVLITGTGSTAKEEAAGVVLECISGKPSAAAVLIVDNTTIADTTNKLAPGDLMKATVTVSATKSTETIADLTSGHTFTFKRSGKGGTPSQELIADGAIDMPVANFGKITYTKGAVGGKALGSVTPKEAVNMETSTHVLQIQTGALSGTAKNAFTTTWKHS